MFQRLFGRSRRVSRHVTDALYAEIVAAARQPAFYSAWGVPDTPLGRFEMIALHMVLFMRRLHDEPGDAREIAQTVVDDFFEDVDHSIRELGVGDLGVPKRMKKLARMFYGRLAAYGDALERSDTAALAAALGRNVRPDAADWAGAEPLAGYAIDVHRALAGTEAAQILGGALHLPAAQAA